MSRKTGKEARAERITWFAMIAVFLFLSFDDTGQRIADSAVCFLLAFILFVSGIYQYRKGWRVSPVTWISCALLGVVGGYDWYWGAPFDVTLVALFFTVAVIAAGVVTNDS